ncbi:MAG: hypothetical protein AAFO89_00385, partial [Planctomycetota bacterium]
MTTLRVSGMALASVCLSGLSFADESSVRAHLAQDESTAYLQQAGARLELLPPENLLAADVFVFQKFVGDLPIHGAQVIVIENADGTVGEVFDDSTENLQVRPGLVTIDQGLAIDLAE